MGQKKKAELTPPREYASTPGWSRFGSFCGNKRSFRRTKYTCGLNVNKRDEELICVCVWLRPGFINGRFAPLRDSTSRGRGLRAEAEPRWPAGR